MRKWEGIEIRRKKKKVGGGGQEKVEKDEKWRLIAKIGQSHGTHVALGRPRRGDKRGGGDEQLDLPLGNENKSRKKWHRHANKKD